jgi:hypothetical protein
MFIANFPGNRGCAAGSNVAAPFTEAGLISKAQNFPT